MPSEKVSGTTKGGLETWRKRWDAAVSTREEWEKRERTKECYDYWRGNQLINPFNKHGVRKCQVNKIHPEVRNAIPSLYFYRPFARIMPKPELEDTPGTTLSEQTQLLQDTVNHFIRHERVRFVPSTSLSLKESFWAMGVCEIGYSASFMDDPNAERPALREKKDTDIGKVDEIDDMDEGDIDAEIALLQSSQRSEQFFVKHIPSNQVVVSMSDKPILEDNDWVGYWDDVPLSDVKEAGRQGVYEHTEKLKAGGASNIDLDESISAKKQMERDERLGEVDRVRLYKIWDLRTKTKLVFTDEHEHFLYKKKFKRCALKFLRFDVDPYHFYPKPPIFHKLGSQDEYNKSRQWLTDVRDGIVPRYTYDEDGIDKEQMVKLEKGIMGTYVPRKAGTRQVIEPIDQPSFSENAIQTLTLSDKEFADVGGVGGDPQVARTKTATQAKIAEVKDQVQEGYDRQTFARFLSEVAEELLMLAIDNMLMDQWVARNVAPDSQMAQQEAMQVSQQYQMITSQKLQAAASGIEFDVDIDIESLSPVTEEERFQKLMQAISFIANPDTMKVFAVAPPLLLLVLKYMGIRSANETSAITGALQKLMEIQMAQAQQGVPPGPGVSPQPGGNQPGQPGPAAQQSTPGGPQPGGPPGPGASVPK